MLKNQHVLNSGLSGNNYRVPTLSKSYLIVVGIIMQNQNNSNIYKLTKRDNRNGRADVPNLIIEKLHFKNKSK